jgi:hypothetical protein
MRRIIGAIVAATLVGVGAVATTAGAAAADRTRTVEFTGTSVFDASSDCSPIHQVYDGALTTNRGDTVHIDGCVGLLSFPFTFTGTFVIDSPGRHDLRGTVSGVIGTAASGTCSDDYATVGFEFVLTPTAGAGRPIPPLEADGTWCSPGVVGVAGPISGTLTGALPPGGNQRQG